MEPSSKDKDSQTPQPPKRIWTQIHRRKKAKAEPPMTDEWDDESPTSPSSLRMSSENMDKS